MTGPLVAAAAWLPVVVLAVALASLGPRSLAEPCGRASSLFVPAWAVLVASLAAARLPGVEVEVEALWTRWGRDLGLLACASLGVVAGVSQLDPSQAPLVLQALVLPALFVAVPGLLVGAVVGAGVWASFVRAVARLPRGSTRQEVARAGSSPRRRSSSRSSSAPGCRRAPPWPPTPSSSPTGSRSGSPSPASP